MAESAVEKNESPNKLGTRNEDCIIAVERVMGKIRYRLILV